MPWRWTQGTRRFVRPPRVGTLWHNSTLAATCVALVWHVFVQAEQVVKAGGLNPKVFSLAGLLARTREKNGKRTGKTCLLRLRSSVLRRRCLIPTRHLCHLFPPFATPLCDELRPGDPLPPCKDWGARYDSRGRMYAHVAHVTHQQGVLQVRWTCLQQFEYVEPRLTRNLNQSFVGSAAGAHHGLVRDRFWWRGPVPQTALPLQEEYWKRNDRSGCTDLLT